MRLTVKPLKQKDAGRGLAAIDRAAMDELELENGDYIVLEGKQDSRAVARVWPGYPEDEGKGIVRIDGQLRQEANVGIDDPVNIEKADVNPATSVTVALPQNLRVRGNVGPMIRNNLSGQAVTQGQTVPVSFGLGPLSSMSGQKIPLKIAETEPSGTVVVTDSTDIQVSEMPAEQVHSGEGAPEASDTPDVTYEDIGGLDRELEQVREMIELPMRHPELFQQLGIEPPKGVLLHGPPGTGKTLMAKAVANEIDAYFTTISGPEIMSKYYGESEEQLREVFEEAEENAPAIVFIDEIDSIAPKRGETQGDVERRVVAQLLSLMDGLEERGQVIVIGATNRVDDIDPALRRGGRFDREIEIGVPDKKGRKEILQVHTRGMPLSEEINIENYAENTHGFVGADLATLTKESAMNALRRIRPELDLESDEIDAEVLERLEISDKDFREAMKGIEPSALREVFVEVPDVTWDSVGGLEDTKERLRETIQWPLEYEDVFESMDLEAAKGVLMYGPPGTGKTLLAKAVANEAQSNFISVKGPELLNKFVGESEKGVREVFSKARENAPTVVFFDEIDSIAGERGGGTTDSGVGERVVSQLLTELDGIEDMENVVVVATTNRPDLIDDALLRPGRLDRHVHVPVPDEEARRAIFQVHTRDKPLADGVDLDELASRTDGYVGADIEAVAREASMAATREFINSVDPEDIGDSVSNVRVTMDHFEHALSEVGPSVTEETRERYDEIEQRFDRAEPGVTDESTASRTFQ
ncbi:ATPase AAA [Haloarcula hispanica N601]|uniref:AAA family ATPase n=3 Tax=Haloarcula hispanica TaxID=51589 RepID=A0A482SZP3_HALHI|nr:MULTISPECIES: CDC48 family AAA ATPase [Haloarcula]AEM57047.1 cell division control protein 48 / AAA family ATPase, CDC48 subfamily [Haloarcula hispanica ATCC 33960]AHB65836.1 ATPase AAA [Haloarcula hispanica N601]KAA9409740.1 AAA family ATPase [Haloarcula hispanica]KZX48525.1 AAA family ATPase [Haloarcula sp. K1]MCJ0618775.1 CDC48 family AAA ATPase [Haloarcula hispanica]